MRRIGITNPIAIALVGILITCVLAFVGCSPFDGYIALDAGSGLLQPTFRMYADQYFQERVGRITSITVSKSEHFSGEQKLKELELRWDDSQTVWDLEYKYTDSLMKALLKRLLGLSQPVSRLTYGEVTQGYEEKVKAKPLEPGQSYFVEIWGHGRGIAAFHGTLEFTIRLDDTGRPDRLEYRLPDDIFERTRDALKLNPETRE